jgi:hypothetical protein
VPDRHLTGLLVQEVNFSETVDKVFKLAGESVVELTSLEDNEVVFGRSHSAELSEGTTCCKPDLMDPDFCASP